MLDFTHACAGEAERSTAECLLGTCMTLLADAVKVEAGEASHKAAQHRHSIASLFRKAAAANNSSTAARPEGGSDKNMTGEAAKDVPGLASKPSEPKQGAAGACKAGGASAASYSPRARQTYHVKQQPLQAGDLHASLSPVLSQPHADPQQATVSRILEQASPRKAPAGALPGQKALDALLDHMHNPSQAPARDQPHDSGCNEQEPASLSSAPGGSSAVQKRSRDGASKQSIQGDQHTASASAGAAQVDTQMPDRGRKANAAGLIVTAASDKQRHGDSSRASTGSRAAAELSLPRGNAPREEQKHAASCRPSTGKARSAEVVQLHDSKEAAPAGGSLENLQAGHKDRSAPAAQGGSCPNQEQHPPEEVLPDVDVAEQRRIMRDIWLRQNVSRASPKAGDKSSGAVAKKKLKREGEHGAGEDAGAKQLRINAMFKAPTK